MCSTKDIIHWFTAVVRTALLAAVAAAAGCIYDDPAVDSDDADFEMKLAFSTRVDADGPDADDDKGPGHDADAYGEDRYNENAIRRVLLFFYPQDADDDTAAVYCVDERNINSNREVSLRVDADLRVQLGLLTEGDEARVFAVVNLPEAGREGTAAEAPKIAPDATVNQIRQTVIWSDFRVAGGTMSDFVMLGGSKVQVVDRKSAAGRIPVTRTAAKIRLAVNVLDEVEGSDPSDPDNKVQKWRPMKDQMRVYLTNGVRMAHIGGARFSRGELERAGAYYNISPSDGSGEGSDFEFRARKLTPDSGIGEYPYWHNVPLYSYPHRWENTPYEERQTYLVVQVPWVPDGQQGGSGNQDYRIFYYSVPVNLRGGAAEDENHDPTGSQVEGNTLESNMYYLIKLTVGMLGSPNREEPQDLEATYEIVPWQTELIDAQIPANRYLIVPQTDWSINNEADLDIPFYTSHETIVVRIKYRFWNFNPAKGTYVDDDEKFDINYDGCPLRRTFTWELGNDAVSAVFNASRSDSGEKICDVTIDNDKLVVSYHHDMKRWVERSAKGLPVFDGGYFSYPNLPTAYLEKSDDTNWSIISAEITIIHKDLFELGFLDNTRFQQTIYITQYPSLYIEPSLNQAFLDEGRYVFVNGNNTPANNPDKTIWNAIPFFSSAGNQNPNMYVITISQFGPEDADKIIGDPRSLTVNNNLSDGSFGTKPEKYDQPSDPWVESGSGNGRWRYRYQENVSPLHPHYPGFAEYTWITEDPVEAPGIDGEFRQISSYYPTDESSDAGSKANFVAPKLRIASSYSTVAPKLSKTQARRRCATYQEMGYPAGRWRLPTRAEVQFIANLSTREKIPVLFNPYHASYVDKSQGLIPPPVIRHYDGCEMMMWSHYWCAQGAAYIEGYEKDAIGQVFVRPDYEVSVTPAEISVRCVYDEWYWNKEDGTPDILPRDKWRIFTWGDKPKQSPQD